MTVLILTNATGGLYSFRRELLQRLLTERNRVIISSPHGSCDEKIIEMGCEFLPAPFNRRGMNPVKDFSLFRTYRKLLRDIKPDVVLTYTVKPNMYGGLACRLTGTPVISTVTGMGVAFEKKGVLRFIAASLYKLGQYQKSVLVFQNKRDRELFKELRIGKSYRLVPGSGVNLTYHCFEQYPDANSTIRISYVGRLMKIKGIDELLQAAAIVRKSYPNVQFDLIGSFDDDYRDIVQNAENSGIVSYLGPQKEMHEYYKNSWAVIMPSHLEGMSNVCLEAAATGRPVLATTIPGCKETFDDGVSGIGFAAKSTEALREAIEKFLALSYEEKVAMGAAGRKKMEQEFDRKQVVQAYMTEIKRAVGEEA